MVPGPLLAILVGFGVISAVLWDAFETIVLPRRVSRQVRIARLFYRFTWRPYATFMTRVQTEARRETALSFYGPMSLLLLFGIWAVLLIIGFGVLQWAAGSAISTQDGQSDFATDLYFSGTSFFTLGLGDIVPRSAMARLLTVVEAGTGFAFLALVIGYLPLVYQLFARRETNVSLLDQRAGSPPSAAELLRRNVEDGDLTALIQLLRDWETWVADLLESHLSYPPLAYFRSQHENQSWVAALTVILDVSAFVLACGANRASRQAAFTFAVSRHAVADLAHIFGVSPRPASFERLDLDAAQRLFALATRRALMRNADEAAARLVAIRNSYEPYLGALSTYLLMPLPHWLPEPGATDNWEITAWDFDSPVPLLGPESPFKKA